MMFEIVGRDEELASVQAFLGFHFGNSVKQGLEVGNDVAKWKLKRYFRRAD